MENIEHEICNNCKKEIPQTNYIMHTMHCSRNITLCKICNEPIPKLDYENHREKCRKPKPLPLPQPDTLLEKSSYFQQRKNIEDTKLAARKANYLKKHEHLIDHGFTLRETVTNGHTNNNHYDANHTTKIASTSNNYIGGGAIKKEPKPKENNDSKTKNQSLLACKYCDLELPKLDLDEHEDYCGTRTDKCLECGELVMFKNKQVHLDSNHGFVKLKDEPGPRPSWESTTSRSASTPLLRSRFSTATTDFDYDPMPYLPNAYQSSRRNMKKKDGESYKEISRRLDCKTEYIRNLLHDSACITIPLRSSATAPRNHFNHNKGPAPQPPSSSSSFSAASSVRSVRRNPPTELVIPCEFCDTPIPHEELVQHETGCRPDLARFNPRRNRSLAALTADEDDYYVAPPSSQLTGRSDSPDDEELPCEFCANMVPASQLWRHQLSCTTPA